MHSWRCGCNRCWASGNRRSEKECELLYHRRCSGPNPLPKGFGGISGTSANALSQWMSHVGQTQMTRPSKDVVEHLRLTVETRDCALHRFRALGVGEDPGAIRWKSHAT